MAFDPKTSTVQTTLTLTAATPVTLTFPMYGSSGWILVLANTGANAVGTCVTRKYAHEADTNPGPDTNLDTKIVAALTAGNSATIEATDVRYDKITFTLTSASGTTITYSLVGR